MGEPSFRRMVPWGDLGAEMLGTDKEHCAILALLLTTGVGYATVHRLMDMAQPRGVTMSEVVGATPRRLTEWLPSGQEALAARVLEARRLMPCAAALIRAAKKRGANFVASHEGTFPNALKSCLGGDCPPLMSCLGEPRLLEAGFGAVVGTRTPSSEGAGLARDCAQVIVEAGHGVISGGADGVDTAAHRRALECGGTTLVVLPQGILSYAVPKEFRNGLDRGTVLLLSQFAPDMTWQTHAAITRNAVIASLATCVCVVEPRRMGGSVRTARFGLAQGKPVFCGETSGTAAECSLALRREGARPLRDDAGALRRVDIAAALATGAPRPCRQSLLF